MKGLHRTPARPTGINCGRLRIISAIVLLYLAAYYLCLYLQPPAEPLIRAITFAALLLASDARLKRKRLRRRDATCLFTASLAFSTSMVLGYHIVIENGLGYDNLLTQSYITPYGASDALALILITGGVYVGLSALFVFARDTGVLTGPKEQISKRSLEPVGSGRVIVLATAIFATWIPYLLAYWPGFLFGDSFASMAQALGLVEWSNHHPVPYTLLIKACLSAGTMLNIGAEGGCAVYCVLQMAFLATCFSYQCNWVTARLGVSSLWALAIAIALCCTPYIATYGIVMWKDPIFSAAVMMATLLIADFVWSKGQVTRRRYWSPLLSTMLLVVLFFRNNGILVVALLLAALLIALAKSWRSMQAKPLGLASCLVAATLTIYLVVTGPVYSVAGVKSDSNVEGGGVLLNQMARVVAYDGDMSDLDRTFMDSLLPLEKYKDTYRPCSVDLLKWDEDFNEEAMSDDFMSHWLSMLVRNPRTYFEAWELQTCGFWSVNIYAVNRDKTNIARGAPLNTTGGFAEEFAALGIHAENLLGNDALRGVFKQDEGFIPAGWMNWAVALLAIFAALLGRGRWVIPLIPSLALALTLMAASPVWHWARYAAAEHFLIPFYLTFFVILLADVAESPTSRDVRSRTRTPLP